MNYVGLDFHKNYPTATTINLRGEILQRLKLCSNKESFVELLGPYKQEVCAVVEACRNWYVAVDLLEGLVKDITLTHPYRYSRQPLVAGCCWVMQWMPPPPYATSSMLIWTTSRSGNARAIVSRAAVSPRRLPRKSGSWLYR